MKKILIPIIGLLFHFYSTAQIIDSFTRSIIIKQKQYEESVSNTDPVSAFKENLQLAQAGVSKAMIAVALNYKFGTGTLVNYTEAINWFQKAEEKGSTDAMVYLGEMYKFGFGVPIDYKIAYSNFCKAAQLNNTQGIYAKGYMLYKGLGCEQDYTAAFQLFKQAAQKKASNGMYFLGLCYRNGYGTPVNQDSAKYWLAHAAVEGYQKARNELASDTPENVNLAGTLTKQIEHAKQYTADKKYKINEYTQIKSKTGGSDISGVYNGYLLKYDWSGKQIIELTPLALNLNSINGQITGTWREGDSINIQVQGDLDPTGIVFRNMQYKKADHYNKINPLRYDFQKAPIQIIKGESETFLEGNIQLFIPQRKEPEKPLKIVLKQMSKLSDQNSNSIFVQTYPNPFKDILNIEFKINNTCQVYTELISSDGKIVYSTNPEKLSSGTYILPIQTNLASGAYIVKVVAGLEIKTIKVIRQ